MVLSIVKYRKWAKEGVATFSGGYTIVPGPGRQVRCSERKSGGQRSTPGFPESIRRMGRTPRAPGRWVESELRISEGLASTYGVAPLVLTSLNFLRRVGTREDG